MLQNIRSVTAVATLVIAVGLAGMASAQAPLGLSIDPTKGFPGDVVDAMVNTDDIAANCPADSGPMLAGVTDILFFMVAETPGGEEFCDEFFPDGCLQTPDGFMNYDQVGYFALGQTLLGIFADIPSGATQDAFEQTFALVFANLAQEIQGDPSTFDRTTGLGSLMVPNVDPGLWAVAAACVLPTLDTLDLDPLREAIHGTGLILEAGGFPLAFPDPFDPAVQEFYAANAAGFLEPVLVPQALGVQLFTVLAHLNHFQCYRARTTGFNQMPVTLADRFGTRSATVRKPLDLCAPADKNGEDPEAPESPFFLTSYKISGAGPFAQISPVHAENQFGPVALKLKGPSTILVPTGVSQSGPPSSPDGAFLNDFTCYKARALSPPNTPTPGVVTVQTAFETVQIQPKKPKRLCVPAHKNGGPIVPSQPENLLCYKAKSGPGLPAPAPVVFLANQFGDQTQRLGTRREICIPTDVLE
jgi:hypothetical protein